VVDENPAHHAGRYREEMGAVLPRHRFAVDETEICLIDQGCSLQAVADPLSRDAASGDSVEFLMDERNQPSERGFVALSPLEQQSGNLGGVISNAAILGALRCG
jgi:hypothetical protein